MDKRRYVKLPTDPTDPISSRTPSVIELPLPRLNNSSFVLDLIETRWGDLDTRLGSLPNIEALTKFGSDIKNITDLSLSSADKIQSLEKIDAAYRLELDALKLKDTQQDKRITDHITANTTDHKALNTAIEALKQADTAIGARIDTLQTELKQANVEIDEVQKAIEARTATLRNEFKAADNVIKGEIQNTLDKSLADVDKTNKEQGELIQSLGTSITKIGEQNVKFSTELVQVKLEQGNIKQLCIELDAKIKDSIQGQSNVPTGTIIDWVGGMYGLGVPAGYWPCDGTEINAPTSPLHKKKAPDTRNAYKTGGEFTQVGTFAGSNTYSLKGSDLPKIQLPSTSTQYTPSGSVSVSAGGDASTKLIYTTGSKIYHTDNNATNGSSYRYPNGSPDSTYGTTTTWHGHSASFSGYTATITLPGSQLNTGTQTAIDMRPRSIYVTQLIKL